MKRSLGTRTEVCNNSDLAISVKHLHKSFRLPTEQSFGLKQAIFNRLRGIKGYTEQRVLRGLDFEIKKGEFEEIDIQEGQIMNILPDGTIVTSRFNYITDYYGDYCWWRYGSNILSESTYLDDLKNIAKGYGYDSETIDELLSSGFTTDEIEEYIYCCE